MQLQPHLHASSRIAWATKGVENGTQKLLHEVANEVLQPVPPLAVISGPTFALEVAKGLPTAVTVAANDAATAEDFADYLRNPTFRTYTSTDMIGLQVGGAIKNVLAIAAGIADGLGFGANTRAALITRGVTELMRLGAKLGGQSETFMGLGGLGDLVLTCTDNLSRNRRYGIALGQGTPHKLALEEIGQVVEGYDTAREIYLLAKRLRVDMPICATTYQVLFEDLAPAQAVQQLLTRTPKAEFDPD